MSIGMPKGAWLEGMYLSGRDHGYEILAERPEITLIALESKIYNYLMEHEDYRQYFRAVDVRAKKAAERVWYVYHTVNTQAVVSSL